MLNGNRKILLNYKMILPLIGFFFSFTSSTVLALWMILYLLLVLITQEEKFAVQFFIFVQMRSLLSVGIAAPVANVGIVKWICIFGISIFVVIHCYSQTHPVLKSLIMLLCIFSVYAILSSMIISSYPVVAVFKIISYILPFVAVLLSVYKTRDCNCIHESNVLLGLIIFGSIFVYPLSIGYLRNGRFFQGLFNHPNILGVMVAVFIAGYIYENNRSLSFASFIVIVATCAFMIYKSYSRTGMISLIIILLIGIMFLNISKRQKVFFVACMCLFVILLLLFNDAWKDEIIRFFLKGGETIYDITYSRENQINNNRERFLNSPVLGTGFNVPYNRGIRDFSFTFDLVTENGNLVLAILGDTGIIGLLLFIICYYKLFSIGKHNENGYTIFIAPFLVCMGEMAFFSTNNFAIILYLYFAIYMSDRLKLDEKTGKLNESIVFDDDSISV